MTDEIILIKNDNAYTSLKLNEANLWFSSDKYDSLDKMEEVVNARDGKGLGYHGIIPYDRITEVKMNEKSEKMSIKYKNKKDKVKSQMWIFDNVATALNLGDYIGNQTPLSRSVETENSTTTLLKNLLWPLGVIAFTAFVVMNPDFETSGNSRSARKSNFVFMIIRMLHETLGTVGIIAIGGILSLLLIMSAVKRYKSPAQEITFQ